MYKNLNNEKHLFSDTQLFNTAPSGVIKISNNFIRGASGVKKRKIEKDGKKKAVVINDLTQGSIIPKSTLRFNDIMKKYFNDEEILKINMEKLIELDIPNKEGVIDYIIFETDPKTVLEIVGVGLSGSLFGRGYARSERRNRNLYKKSTTFDFDLLIRSIINIPENNTLTHFTFEQLKDCHLRIKNGEDEL